jgi:hypothetical protein
MINVLLEYQAIKPLVSQPWPVPFTAALVKNGCFPAALTEPNLANSIDYLRECYCALFEQSVDVVGEMAVGLSQFF